MIEGETMRIFRKRLGFCVSTLAVLIASLGFASSAFAFSFGGIDYTVLGIGSTKPATPSSFEIYQSGTVINGNVGEDPNTFVTHGIDATVNGKWYFDSTDNCSGRPCASPGTPVA